MSNVEFIVIFALGLFLLVFAANWIRTYSKAGERRWMQGWIRNAEAQADKEGRPPISDQAVEAYAETWLDGMEDGGVDPSFHWLIGTLSNDEAERVHDRMLELWRERHGTAVVPTEPRKGQTLSQPADWTDET